MPRRESARLTFFLPEELPWENRGEAAILMGMLRSFESLGAVTLVLPTENAADLAYYRHPGLSVLPSSIASRRVTAMLAWVPLFALLSVVGGPGWLRRLADKRSEALSALLRAEVVLIGHDNFFAYVGVRSLIRYLSMVVVAKRMGKRLVVYGASIGPLTAQLSPPRTVRRAVETAVLSVVRPIFRRLVLDQVDLITVRDEPSRRFLRDFGSRVEGHLTADLAFLMDAAPDDVLDEALEGLAIPARLPFIGITADRWVARKVGLGVVADASVEEREARLVQMLVKLVESAFRDYGLHALLVPHVTGPEAFQDDRPLLELVASGAPGEVTTLLPDDWSSPLIKGMLGRCDLVVGTRTHSLIGATSLGIPVLALTHETRYKTNGIVGEQLELLDALVPVERLWEPNALLPFLDAALARLDDDRSVLRRSALRTTGDAWTNAALLANLLGITGGASTDFRV